MGMLADIADRIRKLHLPPGFSVCEMGDQFLTEPKEGKLARDWYVEELKCGRYVSLDANGRGDHAVDLNRRVDHLELGQFHLVTDLGTGEHVFNQHQFWKTVHDLTRPGGYVVFDKPVNGYEGHGFYKYDEAFFEDLIAANDYRSIWNGFREMPRGLLYRGCWRRKKRGKFLMPYQGRYQKSRRA